MILRMLGYFASSAMFFVSCLIQFAFGCILALLVSRRRAGRRLHSDGGAARGSVAVSGIASGFPAFSLAAAAAIFGAVLPLGIFGALPIASAALAAGTGAELALSFLCSNLLFNTLVPSTDPLFIWRTGYPRIILALTVGMLTAFLARRFKDSGRSLFRSRPPSAAEGSGGVRAGIFFGLACLRDAWPFLAAGALAQTAFRAYGLQALMNFLFTNPLTSFIPLFFAQANVTNPFFLLAVHILTRLSDFSVLAALALVLRPRGLIAYFAWFAVLAAALGTTMFL